jgi:flagellar biosynthetic protein FliS
MLFNSAQIAILKAEQRLQAGNISGMKKQVETAIEIIDSGLRTSLQIRDSDRESKNLRALYLHMMRRLSEAKLSQDGGT